MAWLWKDHTGVAEAARDHRAGPEDAPAVPGQVRRHLLAASGSSARSSTACAPARRCSTPRTPGSRCADWIPAMLTGTEAPGQAHRRRLRRRAQGDVQRRLGRLSRRGISRAARSEARRSCARGCGRKAYAIDRAGRRPDRGLGQADRPAGGHPGGRRRVRRAPGRRRLGHRAGHAGQDHRHQHLRHDGRAGGPEAGGHPRPVRHRQRQHPAGLLRPGGRPVGRRRHLQLVRQLHPAAAGRSGDRTRH